MCVLPFLFFFFIFCSKSLCPFQFRFAPQGNCFFVGSNKSAKFNLEPKEFWVQPKGKRLSSPPIRPNQRPQVFIKGQFRKKGQLAKLQAAMPTIAATCHLLRNIVWRPNYYVWLLSVPAITMAATWARGYCCCCCGILRFALSFGWLANYFKCALCGFWAAATA